MFERIYIYLLRLFPSAFRSRYQDEALRLYRDRLRDERGFLCRLRLRLDLTADIAWALPQAYRNSYAEAPATVPLMHHFNRVPSFHTLQEEPLHGGAIAIASILSVTALATFTFVLGRPIPHFPPTKNGHISPIQAVIEHINRPISPESVDSRVANSSEQAFSERELSSQVSSSAASVLRRPTQPGMRDLDSTHPAQLQSPAIASSSLPGKTQPVSSLAADRGTTFQDVPIQGPAAPATNLSGRWTGSVGAVEGNADVPQWFIFEQNSAVLTGMGGNSTHHYPIVHGFADGKSVRFDLISGERNFVYNLQLKDGTLRGTLSIHSTNEVRSASVSLTREQ